MPRGTITGICETHGLAEHRIVSDRVVCAPCRAARVGDWRRRAKRLLVHEAGGRCSICGYARSVAALRFHDASAARAPAGRAAAARPDRSALGAPCSPEQALARLRARAERCVLLCANCKAEVEAGCTQLPFGGGSGASGPHDGPG